MRYLVFLLILVQFQVAGAAIEYAGIQAEDTVWTSIGPGNISGRMLSIAFNPVNARTLWAGSASGGLWRSFSAGKGPNAWHSVRTGFPVPGVSTIAFAPSDSSTIYIGTGEVYADKATDGGLIIRETRGHHGIGILKSEDGGTSWEHVLSWERNEKKGVQMIRIDPGDSRNVVAATTEGVYLSRDSGKSWNLLFPVRMATDIWIHPTKPGWILVACGNLGSEQTGLYRTKDFGISWEKMALEPYIQYHGKVMFASSPLGDDVVFASIGGGSGRFGDEATWLLQSRDAGTTWQVLTRFDYSRWQGWYAHFVAPHPTDTSVVFVGGYELHKSTDGGKTFTSLYRFRDDSSRIMYADQHAYAFHPENPEVFYVANDGGVYRTEDGGDSFQSSASGLVTGQFYNGTSSARRYPDFFIGGMQDRCVAHYTGQKDRWYTNRCDGAWTAIDPRDDATYYVSMQYLGIQKRHRLGGPEIFVYPPCSKPEYRQNAVFPRIAFIAPFVLAPSSPDRLYAGCDVVYVSTDRGVSWAAGNGGRPLDGNPVISMAVAPSDPDLVVVGTAPSAAKAGLFVSRDGGESWKSISSGLPDRIPMDIAIDPNAPGRIWVVFGGYGPGKVFRSENGGDSWHDFSGSLSDLPVNAVFIDPDDGGTVYVGNDRGVFRKSEASADWKPFGTGLPDAVMVMDLVLSASNRVLRAATHGNGVYEIALPGPQDLVR